MRADKLWLEAELKRLRVNHNVAVANGLMVKSQRFARQIRAVQRKLNRL